MNKLAEIKNATFSSESEVETRFIEKLLGMLGYKSEEIAQNRTIANVPPVFRGENKKEHKRPDFIIYDKGKESAQHALFIVEAKDPSHVQDIQNHDDSIAQAWAYATALETPVYMLCSGKRTLVYRRQRGNKKPGKDTVILNFSQEELNENILADLKNIFDRDILKLKKRKIKADWDSINLAQGKATSEDFIATIAEFIPKLTEDIKNKLDRLIRQNPEFAKRVEELDNPNVQKLSDDPKEDIVLRAAYSFLFKLLFAKIYEDKSETFIFHFKPFILEEKKKRRNQSLAEFVGDLVKDAFLGAKEFYSSLFEPEPIFDNLWPSEGLMAQIVEEISRYNFLPVNNDMIGGVYHQALLNQVTQRKTGSFFTPRYIINEILKSIPIKDLHPAKKGFRAVDLYCGSGTFLIELYDYLKPIIKSHRMRSDKETVHEKLIKRLYGCDIDPFATQLTIINLILKDAMQRNGWQIACGDSFRYKQLLEHGDDKAPDAIQKQVFHYKKVFNEKFDLVVGNPPYGAKVTDEQKTIFKRDFVEVRQGGYDTYRFAIYQAIDMLKSGGYMGFIAPNTWLTIKSAEKLRKYILRTCRIARLVNLQQNVFCLKGAVANVDTMLIILQKNVHGKEYENDDNMVDVCIMDSKGTEEDLAAQKFKLRHSVRQGDWKENDGATYLIFNSEVENKIIDHIVMSCEKLSEILEVSQGLIPYDKYRGHTPDIIKNRIWHSNHKVDDTYLRELSGRDIHRYGYTWNGRKWLKYGSQLAAPRDPKFFTSPRLVFQSTRNLSLQMRLCGAYIEEVFVNDPGLTNVVTDKGSTYLKCILAILNSNMMNWFFKTQNPTTIHIYPTHLRAPPIRPSSPEVQAAFAAKVDRMLEINKEIVRRKSVGAGLKPARAGGSETLPYESWPIEKIKSEIAHTDAEIDRMVYDLYGLTEEEIKIVEGSAK